MKLLSKIFLFIAFLIACNNSKKMTDKRKDSPHPSLGSLGVFDKEGHRGCRGLMPENTIPAMLYAIGMGVTTLEMDIVFTKDGKAILSHEPFFNHEITTKPDGTYIDEQEEKNFNIYKMDYAEVQAYDVGLKPHPRFPKQEKIKASKPLLADVFAAVKKDMMTRKRPFPFFNIETKTTPATDDLYHPKPAEFVEKLMQVISDNGMEDHVIIQSFDFRTLQYLHQHYPTIKTAMLIEGFDKRSLEDQLIALGFIPTIYSPAFELVNNMLIKKCHQQNIQVIPWTVNDKKEIDRLTALGADGIITDYPNLFNE
jgi:glycerophosphoryl diester phosphodiesterase